MALDARSVYMLLAGRFAFAQGPRRLQAPPIATQTVANERERRLERALRLARMALVREEHDAHECVAVIDNALRED